MQTVLDAFLTTAARAPDLPFFCAPPAPGRPYHPDGIELTYGEMRARVLAARDRYAAAGYGHGHRVALLLENRPEFFVHYLALNGLGCGIVPVNPDYRHDEMLYQLDQAIIKTRAELGDKHAAVLELTAVYHNLLRRWAEV